MPEVMDVYRMAGDVDYLLRVTAPNMAAFDDFYQILIKAVPLKNVTSRFAMERVKSTTAYPLPEPLAGVRRFQPDASYSRHRPSVSAQNSGTSVSPSRTTTTSRSQSEQQRPTG